MRGETRPGRQKNIGYIKRVRFCSCFFRLWSVIPLDFLRGTWNFSTIGLPRWCSGKESTCQCRRCKRCGFDPWIKKTAWSRKWQSTPVFLPGKSHGQRSLAGYSPWDHKELDVTYTKLPPPQTLRTWTRKECVVLSWPKTSSAARSAVGEFLNRVIFTSPALLILKQNWESAIDDW